MTKTIVATAIGTILAALVVYFVPSSNALFVRVASWAWASVSWVGVTLVASHLIPGWAILALGLLALFGPITLGMRLTEALQGGIKHPVKEHPFIEYVEDMVDGVLGGGGNGRVRQSSTFGASARCVTRNWCTAKQLWGHASYVNVALRMEPLLRGENVVELLQPYWEAIGSMR